MSQSSASSDDANPELEEMTRRFWMAAALTLPLLALMVADMLPGRPGHAILAAGLEPSLGFFHTPRSAAHPLVLDLMPATDARDLIAGRIGCQ